MKVLIDVDEIHPVYAIYQDVSPVYLAKYGVDITEDFYQEYIDIKTKFEDMQKKLGDFKKEDKA